MTCRECTHFWNVQGRVDVGYCRRGLKLVGLNEAICENFDERVFQSLSEFGEGSIKFGEVKKTHELDRKVR